MSYQEYQETIRLLRLALDDERAADAFYTSLLPSAPNYLVVEALLEARHDERYHAREIIELLTTLTGQKPIPATPVIPPSYPNFMAAWNKAIEGEKEAIALYTSILNFTPVEEVKKEIAEILEDEIVHLEKFQALVRFGLINHHGTDEKAETHPNTAQER